MDIEKDVLLKQIEMLMQEKVRRSRQQFEYVRLSLVNVGILSLFGVFSVIAGNDQINANIQENSTFLFALMCVLTLLSVTLFLFWIDDALTIGGIDRFLAVKEEKVDTKGEIYWFEYRNGLNKTRPFLFKKWVFNTAVVLSFISPPFLFAIFTVLHQVLVVPFWTQVVGGVLFFMILTLPLIIWRRFTKRLYG